MLDGTSAAPIISGVVVDNTAVHYSAGHLYFTDYDGGKIKRSDLDGSNVVDVVSGIPGCCVEGIALDLGRDLLYWSSSEGIARSNLDGSDRSDILFETSLALDIGVDSDTGRVYWADNNFHGILTADFAFQNVEAVRGEIDGVEGLAVDSGAGYLYFTALSVPEPPPLAVMGIALAGIGFAHKRTKA
jgi:hypothetical protein